MVEEEPASSSDYGWPNSYQSLVVDTAFVDRPDRLDVNGNRTLYLGRLLSPDPNH